MRITDDDIEPETPPDVSEEAAEMWRLWATIWYSDDDPRKIPIRIYDLDRVPATGYKSKWWDGTMSYERTKNVVESDRKFREEGRGPLVSTGFSPEGTDEYFPGGPPELGLAITEEMPELLVDYDKMRDPETGEIHPFLAERIEAGESYMDLSPSGTGAHEYPRGSIPGTDSLKIDMATEAFPDAKIEVYETGRYTTITEDHIRGTAPDSNADPEFIDRLVEMSDYDPQAAIEGGDRDGHHRRARGGRAGAADAVGGGSYGDREPEKTREELAEIETTDDIADVFDAVAQVRPADITLRSPVTETRGDGTKSRDPTWTDSESGTRLGELYDGWVYRQGDIGLDAVQVVALEERIIHNETDYPSGEDYWDAVDALRDRGAHVPEFDPGEPVAEIPVGLVQALDPDELRRYGRKRGIEWPSTEEYRERLGEEVDAVIADGGMAVVVAGTGAGKTNFVATTRWTERPEVTGGAPVIQLHANKEQRDQAAEMSEAAGVTYAVIESRTDISPLARGDHDGDILIDGMAPSAWFDTLCEGRGVPFSTALALARDRAVDAGTGEPLDELPPVGEDDPAVAQWDGIPRDDDGEPAVDVVHACHRFAFVPCMVAGTNVAVDERPDYRIEIGNDRMQRAVAAYLAEIGFPDLTWEGFVNLALGVEYGAYTDDDGEWLWEGTPDRTTVANKLGERPDPSWYADCPDAHGLAHGLATAVWNALSSEADRNGRRTGSTFVTPARMETLEYEYRTHLTVVLDERNRLRSARNVPSFGTARSVVGLDAHPSMPMWELNVDPGIAREDVLSPEERRNWRRYERNLWTLVVGDSARPRSGDEAMTWFDADRVEAVADEVREAGVDLNVAIATQQTEDAVAEAADVVEDDMHLGGLRGRNDYAGEEALLLANTMDPGDDYVLNALAELGLDAAPPMTPCDHCDETGECAGECHRESCDPEDGICGVCGGKGEWRERGRTWEGKDAETAKAVMASVCESINAQAIGRLARDPDDPQDCGLGVSMTSALPPYMIDATVPEPKKLTKKQRAVADELDGTDQTVREIAEAAGVTKPTARNLLEHLEARDMAHVREAVGPEGADVWRSAADVEGFLVDVAIAKHRLWRLHRQGLAIHGPPSASLSAWAVSSAGEVGGADDDPPPGTANPGG